jgi:hypothetical protein
MCVFEPNKWFVSFSSFVSHVIILFTATNIHSLSELLIVSIFKLLLDRLIII